MLLVQCYSLTIEHLLHESCLPTAFFQVGCVPKNLYTIHDLLIICAIGIVTGVTNEGQYTVKLSDNTMVSTY